jgi:serine/threonine protein kinase
MSIEQDQKLAESTLNLGEQSASKHYYKSFFDDVTTELNFTVKMFPSKDMAANFTEGSKARNQFKIVNLIDNTTISSECMLFETYIGVDCMDHNVEKFLCLPIEMVIISIKNVRPDGTFSFIISKNKKGYEFISSEERVIEMWMNQMKTTCIQINFHESYKPIQLIANGSSAKVYLAKHLTSGKYFAIKAFCKNRLIKKDGHTASAGLINELKIMKLLNHPNIVRLYELHETQNSIYVVMDLCQGKTLNQVISCSTFSDTNCQKLMKDLLTTVNYLHSKGIMHRDLKPDNIIVDASLNIKLVDFGLATKIMETNRVHQRCGTPGYIAPEIFTASGGRDLNEKCDMFSLGCILFYMIFRRPLFLGHHFHKVMKENEEFRLYGKTIVIIVKKFHNSLGVINKNGMRLLIDLLETCSVSRSSSIEALHHPYISPIYGATGDIPVNSSSLTTCTSVLKDSTNSEVDLLSAEALEQLGMAIKANKPQDSPKKITLTPSNVIRNDNASIPFENATLQVNSPQISNNKRASFTDTPKSTQENSPGIDERSSSQTKSASNFIKREAQETVVNHTVKKSRYFLMRCFCAKK